MRTDRDGRRGYAVVMRRYGPPEVLGYERVPLPPLLPDEIRIRSIGSAVNHSDLEIRAGNWPIQKPEPFPYVPGLEVVGEVIETGDAVTGLRAGERVITMMQGLGGVRARRPGGYAEHVTVAAAAAAPVPADLDPLAMASLGLASVTAYEGLAKLGALVDRRIVVTGASGGVGSAAVGIAKASGAAVIGVVSRNERAAYVRLLGAEAAHSLSDVVSGALGEEAVDGVLDTVGGALFGPCVAALKPGGRLSLVGSVAGGTVSFDAYRLLDVVLTGYGSENLDGTALSKAVAAIGDWLRQGALTAPARTVFPLAEAARAHETLERRGVEGRLLLVP
jgi:NADPH2:quinone reductase